MCQKYVNGNADNSTFGGNLQGFDFFMHVSRSPQPFVRKSENFLIIGYNDMQIINRLNLTTCEILYRSLDDIHPTLKPNYNGET